MDLQLNQRLNIITQMCDKKVQTKTILFKHIFPHIQTHYVMIKKKSLTFERIY